MSLDVKYLFWQVLVFSVNGCSAVSCDFGVLKSEGELEALLLRRLVLLSTWCNALEVQACCRKW